MNNISYVNLQTKIKLSNYYNPFQLKDGTLLLYNNYKIILLKKNFQQVELINFPSEDIFYSSIKTVHQLKNGEIIILHNDLYIINIKDSKIINKKIIENFMFKLINDLIFLEDESIYGITKDDSIVKIEINDKDEENVKITEIYKFPNDWKIKEDIENKSYNNFNYNYLESYYIKNNKLLIIFKKNETVRSWCGNALPYDITKNKIHILDLEGLNSLYSSEEITGETYIIIFKKYICGCIYRNLFIFDINNFELLKDFNDISYIIYANNYDENSIITISEKENKYVITIYNLLDINNIKYKNINIDFTNINYYINNRYEKIRDIDKWILKIKERKMIFYFEKTMYIIELFGDINYTSYKSLEEMQ